MAINLNGTTGITTTGLTSNGIDDNATSTAMTLDTSGNVLVGKTSTGYNSGTEISYEDFIRVNRTNGSALYIGRNSSDGELVSFRKDGTDVGSIGAASGDLVIGTTDTGIHFHDGVDSIIPWNVSTVNYRDAAIDFGTPSYRFKDLYLSGGVYLGGVGSSNKLDDYEEGTWTPTLGRSIVNPTTTYSRQSGYYIKVGAMVTLFFNMEFGTVSNGGSGTLSINGIPFNTSSDTNMRAAGTFGYNNAIVSTGVENIRIQSTDGANSLLIVAQTLDSTVVSNLFSAAPTSNSFLQGSITYKTDS